MKAKAEVEVSGTSNVEQATDKAGKSLDKLQKQIADINKKFENSFKDIFLSFFAPLALLTTAINFIQSSVAQAKQDAKDGLDLLSRGESRFGSAEESKAASYFKTQNEIKREKELTEAGRQEITRSILQSPMSAQLGLTAQQQAEVGTKGIEGLVGNKDVQERALKLFMETPEGKAAFAGKIEQGSISTDFKGPEGFSNVIGVGANPILDQTSQQTEIQREILAQLEIANQSRNTPQSTDFTKSPGTAEGTPIPRIIPMGF